MASRRAELLRLVAAALLELAELEEVAEAAPPPPPAPSRRRRPVRLALVPGDDAPVSDLAAQRAKLALLHLGMKP
jgi:hypothetical protein